MRAKFILTNKATGEIRYSKSLREISQLLRIDYFQARSIYLESKSPKKFLHPITKQLVEKYSIVDNPYMFDEYNNNHY